MFSTMFIVIASYAIVCTALLDGTIHGHPVSSESLFSHDNKLGSDDDSSVARSFQEFIHSEPDSTIIGELKPNSSELEMMALKKKIASAIVSMQEMEKGNSLAGETLKSRAGECYISVTKVERIAGVCRKVNNGLPICQSDNYMAVNTECN